MEIRKQKWQYALEKDYFTLTQDDRFSMQKGFVDMPSFGNQVLPTSFSPLFYDRIDEEDLWGYLRSEGWIDSNNTIIVGPIEGAWRI